ncbi:hypothetical protein KPH14_004079 [Odynerus spinipes]|uniref:Uncharacterized protein n=1 Tax=Odynerus spinipes TaxID=1348599 RepID=A0AAD9VV61_9HYME|nr:hypothetical protein KPH14_004079 [Odynerus spinipes]
MKRRSSRVLHQNGSQIDRGNGRALQTQIFVRALNRWSVEFHRDRTTAESMDQATRTRHTFSVTTAPAE